MRSETQIGDSHPDKTRRGPDVGLFDEAQHHIGPQCEDGAAHRPQMVQGELDGLQSGTRRAPDLHSAAAYRSGQLIGVRIVAAQRQNADIAARFSEKSARSTATRSAPPLPSDEMTRVMR